VQVGVVNAKDLDSQYVAGLAGTSFTLLLDDETSHFQFAVRSTQDLLEETVVQLSSIISRSHSGPPICFHKFLGVGVHFVDVVTIQFPSCTQASYQAQGNVLLGVFAHSVKATLIFYILSS
jgi:hypothetical protein